MTREANTQRSATAPAAIAALLAACAGGVDTLAFFGVGKAFAGIVTGNLVTAGYGIAHGDGSLIWPTITAVVGCVLGEFACAGLLRRGVTPMLALISEQVLLTAVLGIWLATDSHPHGAISLTMLALLSVSLGSQSIWALRVHQTTTYFTGMLTNAVNDAAGGSWARTLVSVRQLAGLVGGALLGGAVLRELRAAAPVVPIVLLAIASILQRSCSEVPRHPRRSADNCASPRTTA